MRGADGESAKCGSVCARLAAAPVGMPVSALVQPTTRIQLQLPLSEGGFSLSLIDRLIVTNFWLRRIPYAVCAGLFLWMAAQVVGEGGEGRAA